VHLASSLDFLLGLLVLGVCFLLLLSMSLLLFVLLLGKSSLSGSLELFNGVLMGLLLGSSDLGLSGIGLFLELFGINLGASMLLFGLLMNLFGLDYLGFRLLNVGFGGLWSSSSLHSGLCFFLLGLLDWVSLLSLSCLSGSLALLVRVIRGAR